MDTNRRDVIVYCLGVLPFLLNIAVFTFYSFRGFATILYALLILVYLNYGYKYKKQAFIIRCFLIPPLCLYFFSAIFHGALPNRGILLGLVYGFILLGTCRADQIRAFEVFLNCTCLLLLFSILEFVIVELFGKGLLLGQVVRVEEAVFDRTTFFNHYLFNIIKEDVIVRFQSIMEEPGNVGTLCGLLLFVIGKNAKYIKQFYIILISGFLSLSMAFFALFAMYVICNFSIRNIKATVIIAIVIIGGVTLFKDQFENKIILRLQSEKVDDRSNEVFDQHLYLFAKERGLSFYFGNGAGATNSIDIGRGVVGAKRELYDYGIVGCLLLFISSLVTFFKYNGVSKHSLLFFIAFWLSWYQRADIFNPSNVLLFINILNVVSEPAAYSQFRLCKQA